MAKRCVIICAGEVSAEDLIAAAIAPEDFVIAADAGYLHAARLGLRLDLIVGDFDSAPAPANPTAPVELYPSRKDDTDALLAVRRGLEESCDEFVILGGLGGRLDHTIANIQVLDFLAGQGCTGTLLGQNATVTVLRGASLTLPPREGYLSIFALGGDCRGVTEQGLSYALDRATLTGQFPVGVSNRFTDEPATITVEEGTLLIIMTLDT